MQPQRLLLYCLVPVILIAIGTAGYCLIEGWSVFDSLYMTVITLTTIGYGEVHPLSRPGQAFTMVLALGGIFTLFYVTAETFRSIISGEVHGILERRRMERRLQALQNHLIVCGFGRMGRLVCREFAAKEMDYVVIERKSELQEELKDPHGIMTHGDATSDVVLQRAGIDRARALVSVLPNDADNLYITMSARLLNERLFIVARAEEIGSEQKLLRAGANHVVMPFVIGGNRVAHAVLRPTVVDFIDLATRTEHFALQIEELPIGQRSQLIGRTIQEGKLRQEFEVIILAIKRSSGAMVFNPPSDAVLKEGDILIAIGDRTHLDRLAAVAASGPDAPSVSASAESPPSTG